MRNSDIGYQCNIRLGNPCKRLNLSEIVHPHFKNCRLCVGRKFQYAERKTEPVVKVLDVSARFVFHGCDIIHHIPCARLSDAAGYGNLVLNRKRAEIICRQILQGFRGVLHQNRIRLHAVGQKGPFRNLLRLGDNDRTTSSLKHLCKIIMPVVFFADQRKKQITRLRKP